MFTAINSRPGAIVVAALGLAVLAGCDRPPAPVKATAPAAPAASPLPATTMARADLLEAIAQARAAYAIGAANPSDGLNGRQFSVRQAFGCGGPADAAAAGRARWAWDKARKSIDVSVTPDDWTMALAASGGADSERWEAVEGFWLTHPWLRAEGCPAPPLIPASTTTAPPAPSAPTAGLAAVFEAGGSRVDRRDGRAYTFTLRGKPMAEPPLAGYRLILEGRFTALPDGHVIRCRADNPDSEPVCLAAAQIDRVAIEDAAGNVLREWRKG
jgi:hypothetical protein